MRHDISIRPRVSETDMLGHINNVSVVAWLEEGRSYMVREALEQAPKLPPFMLARLEIDYKGQLYFGEEAQIRSGIERLGSTSLVIRQHVCQRGLVCVRARSVLVHFDHAAQHSVTLSEELRAALGRFAGEWDEDLPPPPG